MQGPAQHRIANSTATETQLAAKPDAVIIARWMEMRSSVLLGAPALKEK